MWLLVGLAFIVDLGDMADELMGNPTFSPPHSTPIPRGLGLYNKRFIVLEQSLLSLGIFLKIKTPLKRTRIFHHSFRRWLSSGTTDPSFIKTQATCLERKESVS